MATSSNIYIYLDQDSSTYYPPKLLFAIQQLFKNDNFRISLMRPVADIQILPRNVDDEYFEITLRIKKKVLDTPEDKDYEDQQRT